MKRPLKKICHTVCSNQKCHLRTNYVADEVIPDSELSRCPRCERLVLNLRSEYNPKYVHWLENQINP